MISSWISFPSITKYALYPVTRTSRFRYASGSFCAARSVSGLTTFTCRHVPPTCPYARSSPANLRRFSALRRLKAYDHLQGCIWASRPNDPSEPLVGGMRSTSEIRTSL